MSGSESLVARKQAEIKQAQRDEAEARDNYEKRIGRKLGFLYAKIEQFKAAEAGKVKIETEVWPFALRVEIGKHSTVFAKPQFTLRVTFNDAAKGYEVEGGGKRINGNAEAVIDYLAECVAQVMLNPEGFEPKEWTYSWAVDLYKLVSKIAFFIAGGAAWIYVGLHYGLLGWLLGWFAAGIAGAIAYAIWPIVPIVGIWLYSR